MKIKLHFLIVLCGFLIPMRASASIVTVSVDDVIHPITAEFIIQGVAQAEKEGASAFILQLSTPGGLDVSMREIISRILGSKVPVIVFVGPSGARAASAGFFIMLAADWAVMAPGTNTGAAHPVSLTGGKIDEVMAKKIENDTTAYLRSFVSKRGRNAELAEKGVIESKSFTETEAFNNHLIDGIAKDIPEIIQNLEGKTLQRFGGESQVLHLRGQSVEVLKMSLRQRILAAVLNPNIALILGLLGLIALYVEFTHTGLILPGVAGAGCLFLALVAFNLLPVNLLGMILILTAIVLFVLEAKFGGHGIFAVLGILGMIVGSVILIDAPLPEMRVSWVTAIGVTLPFAGITIFLLRLILLSQQRKSTVGKEGMVGEMALALEDFEQTGRVQVHGEIWQAVTSTPVKTGELVRVIQVEGLKVMVERPERMAAGVGWKD
jgi:membrane-bound serine protease (ClpP class)